jgi:hypothetical protein
MVGRFLFDEDALTAPELVAVVTLAQAVVVSPNGDLSGHAHLPSSALSFSRFSQKDRGAEARICWRPNRTPYLIDSHSVRTAGI